MGIRVYGLKNCDTCRKARKWLAEKNIDHDFVDVRDNTPSPATLKKWHAALGEALLNRRGTTWRQLPDADKARAEKSLASLLHEHPALMKRPVMINGNDIHLGFDEKAWQGLLKK